MQRDEVAAALVGPFNGKADAAAQAELLQAAGVDGGGEDVRSGGVFDKEETKVLLLCHPVELAVIPPQRVDLTHLPRCGVAHCMHVARLP